jgi:hypothetical protein
MDPLDIHGSIHGSMDVDVTNIHGYPSSDFTATSLYCRILRRPRTYRVPAI